MSDKTPDKDKIQWLTKFKPGGKLTNETIAILQFLIQHDTTNPPGNEMELAKKIQQRYDGLDCDYMTTKIIETAPGRGNLIVTIKGSDPENHKDWGFAGHLDVVPAEGEWDHPPFSGEVVQHKHDRFIYGRGAFDMKQIVAAMIVGSMTLIKEGFRPKGNIKIIYNADEERGGHFGMEKLVNEHWDDVKVDCIIDEGGGFRLPLGNDFIIQRAEKGKCQTKITARGVSGHGSTPPPYEKLAMYKLIKVAERIRKKRQRIYMSDEYLESINNISLPGIAKFILKKKALVRPVLSVAQAITGLPMKKMFTAIISDTIAPTIFKMGRKENVISPSGELTLDIRTLPNHDREFIWNELERLIGKKLYSELELSIVDNVESTTSPIQTEYYHKIEETFQQIFPGANLVPLLGTGGTDMKYFRFKGVPAYGFSPVIKDEDISVFGLTGLAHAPNERISVTNLMLATDFAYRMMKQV